jgi:geranylgeranyl diphosphate synthase type I
MATAKTASLLAASAGIGAILAEAPESTVDALTAFAREVGLAFQFVDDVLGVWGDPAVTGKPVHSDLRSRKKSLPVTYAATQGSIDAELAAWFADPGEPEPRRLSRVAELLDQAGAREWALAQAGHRLGRAEEALASVDIKPQARAELVQLARYVVQRQA